LASIVDDVVALAVRESRHRGVAIRTDIPPDLPVVLGDRVQLQQVLLNLVVNAMDAMATFEESERRLFIRGRLDTDGGRPAVTIGVEDQGIGLRPEDMGRLCEAFYTTKAHGMGLGLAISRSIIEAHGGRLWAEPRSERGAMFAFRLPAADGTAAG
jgi:signal transduction histidine kinase